MKKLYYLTLDTETATLSFVNDLAKTAKEKQTLAITKPLVYDIGWTISDRKGNILKKENFLIQETFFVPQIFNTAYYKEKRPQYLEMIKAGTIKIDIWENVINVLLEDLRKCDFCTAYNAAFDYKKAIPFTERYIKNLYSERYNDWEKMQKESCERILKGEKPKENSTYLEPIFILRDEEFPIIDLWGKACETLINNNRYKEFCLKNNYITESGIYFKTSAESTFAYLMKDKDFVESHTALDDAEIETIILTKILKKCGLQPTLQAFPFRTLGYTYDYVKDYGKYTENVIEKINSHLQGKDDSPYKKRLEKIVNELTQLLEEL